MRAATFMVELLTIELYNLRLANIGNPRLANFEGTLYRGMPITRTAAAKFHDSFDQVDIGSRNFSVPLRFFSSSTNPNIPDIFSRRNRKEDRMMWIIHVHGLDEKLLQRYRALYSDSFVTSICALPIGRVSPLAEQEVLLGGPFFQIVNMTSVREDDHSLHTMELVMLNANRDHGLQHADDKGEKEQQRLFFNSAVRPSKFEVCAGVADQLGRRTDADIYRALALEALEQMSNIDKVSTTVDGSLAKNVSHTLPTWLGGGLKSAYPKALVEQREIWHRAAALGDWAAVQDVLKREYEWRRPDWFRLSPLRGD